MAHSPFTCPGTQAATIYATALQHHPKSAKLHYRLGVVLEEQHHLSQVFEAPEAATYDADSDDDLQDQGSTLTKTEDIRAIADAAGLKPGAAASAVLKALDAEYHSLKAAGNRPKADYVSCLELWCPAVGAAW